MNMNLCAAALENSEVLRNYSITVATIAGGLWAVFKFHNEVWAKAAINLEAKIEGTESQIDGRQIKLLTVTLENSGQVRINAATKKYRSLADESEITSRESYRYVYSDAFDALPFPGCISIKRLDQSYIAPTKSTDEVKAGATAIEWHRLSDSTRVDIDVVGGQGTLHKLPTFSEGYYDYLHEYRVRERRWSWLPHVSLLPERVLMELTDLWIDPGEKISVTVPLVLDEGSYLLKVFFVGPRSRQAFWSQVLYVNCQQQNQSKGPSLTLSPSR